MKFGLMYGGAGPWASVDGARVMAQTAEAAGLDSIWASDHAVLLADDFEGLYRSKGGGWNVSSDYPIMDPMVWLSYLAAITTRITLATGVLILPLRSPVVLANEVASLDLLSGGRVTLGVGSGWLPEELAACGVSFADRMELLEEGILVMRALWQNRVAEFHGKHTGFDRMTLAPRPERDVPIVLGGRVKAAADRAGRLGDGFFPHLRDLDRLAELFDIARRAAEGAGRDPGALEIIAGGAKTPQDLERMQQIGVQHVIFSPRAKTLGELEGSIENYQQTVIQPVFG